MTRELKLTRDFIAIVDDGDYQWASAYKWHASHGKWPYARRSYKADGTNKAVLLHRAILGIVEAGREVYGDHVNGNVLDNRRSNLRICDNALNQANRRPRRGRTTSYKGVRREPTGKWSSRVAIDGVQTFLGCFSTPEEAARAYDEAALEQWGEFARLNFPRHLRAGGFPNQLEEK
jgi:hypothetical protein